MIDLENLAAAKNHFELFCLPVRFTIDPRLLQKRYLDLTRRTHPDFAGPDPEAQLTAMRLSARVNQAFATLSDDLSRAGYILELAGYSPSDQPVDPLELTRVFDLREAVEEARDANDAARLDDLRHQAQTWLNDLFTRIARNLDNGKADPQTLSLIATAGYLRKIAAS